VTYPLRSGKLKIKDVGRRRLLLKGLRHLSVSLRERLVLFLELCEQPHILDGNDCASAITVAGSRDWAFAQPTTPTTVVTMSVWRAFRSVIME
jgi:hypothetical protein